MKKTYISPMLVTSGDVIRETLNGSAVGLEMHFRRLADAGGVGFYL